MLLYAEKSKLVNSHLQEQPRGGQFAFPIPDNRPRSIIQRKLVNALTNSNTSGALVIQRVLSKEDLERLKRRIEELAPLRGYSQVEGARAARLLNERYDTYEAASSSIDEALAEARGDINDERAVLTEELGTGDLATPGNYRYGALCLENGCTRADIRWAVALVRDNPKNLGSTLYMMYTNQMRMGNIDIARIVAGQECFESSGRDLVDKATFSIRSGIFTEANVLMLLIRFLNSNRCPAMLTTLNFWGALTAPRAGAIFALSAQWMNNWIHFSSMISKVANSSNVDKAIEIISRRNCVWDVCQPALDILFQSAVLSVDNIFLVLRFRDTLAGGTGIDNMVHAVTFLDANQANPVLFHAAQLLLTFSNVPAQLALLLAYVGGVANNDLAEERFEAVKAAGGNIVNATQTLANTNFSLVQVTHLLQISAVPNIHIRNNRDDARRLAEERAGVGANSCIETGLAGMATELLRLMIHFRGVIGALANNQDTPLMTYRTLGASYLCVSIGDRPAERLIWANTEVVIGKDAHGNLFVRHCQPNA